MGAVAEGFQPLPSPYFQLEEIVCKCGCGWYQINDVLIYRLQILRARLGHRPLYVASWCRCEKYNREVGGVNASYHIYGQAVDVKHSVLGLAELVRAAEDLFDGIGIYWGKNFVHLDVRGWKSKWQE